MQNRKKFPQSKLFYLKTKNEELLVRTTAQYTHKREVYVSNTLAEMI